MTRRVLLAVALLAPAAAPAAAAPPVFRAGAAAVDVTPERFPVAVNCGFTEVAGTAARDRLHARALVLDDGPTRLAVIIVDSCMMPREFLDRAKESIAAETKIPADRQLIAATHTHTAPAVMGCLGSDPDPVYGAFLERQLVQSVRQAVANLAPATAGWAVASAAGLTNNRQWVLRSDKVRADPFGDLTVRSNMHPGYLNQDFVGPSGPVDPWLTALSVRTLEGKPLALLTNFSMHYFGSAPVSADYFGRVCALLEKRVGGGKGPAFVALHSQGTAGDLHWMDYGKPQKKITLDEYAEAVADRAAAALDKVRYRADVTLAMAETTLTLGRRTPAPDRLAWARKVVAGLDEKKPKTQPEIYAREAVMLHDEPTRELKLQALRVGDLGIVAIPNEVFALTGLKIKAASPLVPTFTVELANGADGYIPPAEQHVLGGYTTWPARSAGLEAGAEAKVVEAVLGLLEKVAGKKRRALPDAAADPYAKLVLAAKPVGYWRLGEFGGAAADLAGKNPGAAEPGVVFGLDGPVPRRFDGQTAVNRAAHFAGGRVVVKLPALGETYAVEAWVWNGFPAAARDWTGTPFAFAAGDQPGDALALGGKAGTPNALAVLAGVADAAPVSGKTALPFRTWSHVALVRDGGRVRVYLDGKLEVDAAVAQKEKPETLLIGGRPDRKYGFEGRIGEVAVYDRPLTADEIAARVRAVRE